MRIALLKKKPIIKILKAVNQRIRRNEIVNERRLKYSKNKQAVFESALYVYVKLY